MSHTEKALKIKRCRGGWHTTILTKMFVNDARDRCLEYSGGYTSFLCIKCNEVYYIEGKICRVSASGEFKIRGQRLKDFIKKQNQKEWDE